MLKISCVSAAALPKAPVAVFIADGGKLGESAQKIDGKLGGAITAALKNAPLFKAKEGEALPLLVTSKGKAQRLVLIGAGEPKKLDALAYERLGAAAYTALAKQTDEDGVLVIDALKGGAVSKEASVAAHAALGAQLAAYRFDKYHTKKKDKAKKLKSLSLAVADAPAAKKAVSEAQKIASGVSFARDLVSEPANTLDPAAMAQAAGALKELGVEVTVLGRAQMEKMGMGSLLGVAQGSDKPPFMVALQWKGDPNAKDKRPLALVGKGVTFDTGGISLKPGAGMGDMKYDMAGAAAVLGAMKTLALRKAKANVVGVVGLVENMPSGRALRPGDVLTSASGQTIEVLNTDAEGRLVLADALWYAQDQFKPRAIVDLATLTGAIRIALGFRYAGLFSSDDAFAAALTAAGATVDENTWRMPMHESFDKMLDSPIADMKNISDGPYGGSITAAHFIKRFVNKGTPWAHLDIAGMAWENKGSPLCPKGASGYGVRLLNRLVASYCEA